MKQGGAGHGYRVVAKNLTFDPEPDVRDHAVLAGINLTVAPGEFVAIVGQNGEGKTCLLRAVAGELLGVRGEVTVGSQRITKPISQIIERVGIVHQDDDGDFVEELSIAQNVAIRQLFSGAHKGRFWATGERWMEQIRGLLGTMADGVVDTDITTLVRNLSGGQRQRLSVVVAMYLEHGGQPCRLLLLDEHTSRLDHILTAEVMEYTARHIRDVGTTAIMVTHRYEEALKHADRLLVMYKGRLHEPTRTLADLDYAKIAAYVEGRGLDDANG